MKIRQIEAAERPTVSLPVQAYAFESSPGPRLTAAGMSGLIYGVLDPDEVVLRGFGQVPAEAAARLRLLFPRRIPYLFAHF